MQIGKLLAEALEVTEGALVDTTDQPVQFQKRILQRCGGEKQFRRILERLFQCIGNDVRRLIHIPQPVRFINDDKVPVRGPDIRCFTARELVRADNDVLNVERLAVALLERRIIRPGFQDPTRQKELFLQFLVPCLRRLAGVMTRRRRLRSAHLWERTNPASTVLPKPTSSARMAPLESGDLNANSAASIWCGFKSTCASTSAPASFSTLSEAQRFVSSWAKYFAW